MAGLLGLAETFPIDESNLSEARVAVSCVGRAEVQCGVETDKQDANGTPNEPATADAGRDGSPSELMAIQGSSDCKVQPTGEDHNPPQQTATDGEEEQPARLGHDTAGLDHETARDVAGNSSIAEPGPEHWQGGHSGGNGQAPGDSHDDGARSDGISADGPLLEPGHGSTACELQPGGAAGLEVNMSGPEHEHETDGEPADFEMFSQETDGDESCAMGDGDDMDDGGDSDRAEPEIGGSDDSCDATLESATARDGGCDGLDNRTRQAGWVVDRDSVAAAAPELPSHQHPASEDLSSQDDIDGFLFLAFDHPIGSHVMFHTLLHHSVHHLPCFCSWPHWQHWHYWQYWPY